MQFKILPMPPCSADSNECNTANGGCEHSCTNTIGSYTCSCNTGYQLDENGLNCSGKSLFTCTQYKICMFWYIDFEPLKECRVTLQTSMNATLEMEAVNKIVLTLLGASSAAVTEGTSWMKMN